MAEENVQHHQDGERPQRRKLHLKPRDPEAAARIEAERLRESQHNVFGDAKPREVVIADRVGKREEDILKEEVQKEKLHLRLTPAQHDEKRSHEAAVKEIEEQIENESDEKKKELLEVELRARVEKLDALMERFVNMTLENAKSGEVPRVSQLRKAQQHNEVNSHQHRYKPTQQYSRHPVYSRGYPPPRGGRGYVRGGGRYPPSYGRGTMPEWAKEGYSSQHGGVAVDTGYSGHRGGRLPQPPRDVFYQGPFPGRGVGGEIEFDSFSDQDRY